MGTHRAGAGGGQAQRIGCSQGWLRPPGAGGRRRPPPLSRTRWRPWCRSLRTSRSCWTLSGALIRSSRGGQWTSRRCAAHPFTHLGAPLPFERQSACFILQAGAEAQQHACILVQRGATASNLPLFLLPPPTPPLFTWICSPQALKTQEYSHQKLRLYIYNTHENQVCPPSHSSRSRPGALWARISLSLPSPPKSPLDPSGRPIPGRRTCQDGRLCCMAAWWRHPPPTQPPPSRRAATSPAYSRSWRCAAILALGLAEPQPGLEDNCRVFARICMGITGSLQTFAPYAADTAFLSHNSPRCSWTRSSTQIRRAALCGTPAPTRAHTPRHLKSSEPARGLAERPSS